MVKPMKRDVWYFAEYPDRNRPDVRHYEWRKYDFLRGMDNRISDYRFEDMTYPMTVLNPASEVLPVVIERYKNEGWVVTERESGTIVSSVFKSFDEALKRAKNSKQWFT